MLCGVLYRFHLQLQAVVDRIERNVDTVQWKNTDVTFVYGDYLEVQATGPLTFIPPSMYGPPELVHVDWKDTDAPGLILKSLGKGTVAWFPWNLGSLYYLHSSEAHAGLMRDLIDHLLPGGRPLKTNAHPLVEVTLMSQGDRRFVHLVNLSGHSQTAYFRAVPMSGIEVQVKGAFRWARAIRRRVPAWRQLAGMGTYNNGPRPIHLRVTPFCALAGGGAPRRSTVR